MISSKHQQMYTHLNIKLSLSSILSVITLSLMLFLFPASSTRADNLVHLGYFGLPSDASLFAAIEKRFFSDEGLTAEAVKISFEELSDKFKAHEIDGANLNFRLFQLVELGVDLKVTAGLQSGCFEIVSKKGSGINTVSDLKNQTIAVEELGGAPATAASRLLRQSGINPEDIVWVVAGNTELEALVKNGQAVALIRLEGSIPTGDEDDLEIIYSNSAQGKPKAPSQPPAGHGHGNNHEAANGPGHSSGSENENNHAHGQPVEEPPANPHAHHTSFHHFFDGFVALRGDLAVNEQKKAASITKALIRGVKWVDENRDEAAQLLVDNKIYENTKDAKSALSQYMWMPGTIHAKEHLKVYIRELKAKKILPATIDDDKFYDQIFIQILPDLN